MTYSNSDIFRQTIATYGIIGYPVSHSLSPYMHNAAFAALEVDAEYRLFPLKDFELDLFFKDLKEPENPIFGLNVTVPYKTDVLKYIDVLQPFAKKVGAVNTIVIDEKRQLYGANTDGPGFLAHLQEIGFAPGEKRISILGAGGTTRAILAALCLMPNRPEWIKVYNRTFDKLKSLLDDLGREIDLSIVVPVTSIDDLDVEIADCLINSTSLGLNEEDPCLIDESLLHSDLLVYDVIYTPRGTKLLRMARDKGANVANGLGMLYAQGVLSFQHWADLELTPQIKNVMRKALEAAANLERI